jgi:hypothetical protein
MKSCFFPLDKSKVQLYYKTGYLQPKIVYINARKFLMNNSISSTGWNMLGERLDKKVDQRANSND